MACDQELCPNWAGDGGCPCAVLGIPRDPHSVHIVDDLYDDDCRACSDERNAVISAAARATTCSKCSAEVTDQTPSTFYTHHDETCGGALEEPADVEIRRQSNG